MGFLYPVRCLLCATSKQLVAKCSLCKACDRELVRNKRACLKCGLPLTSNQTMGQGQQNGITSICAQCLKYPRNFDACWSAFIYAQPLEWMIQQLKFNAKLVYAPLLSELMIQSMPMDFLKGQKPDVMIPMPLHRNRLRQRGFNQSLLLAGPISKKTKIKIDTMSAVRLRDTQHQTGKNAQQRQKNIKDAFSFKNVFNYQHVVIFDDVITTGSSVSELCKVIKRAGVKRVDVWSLARAEK